MSKAWIAAPGIDPPQPPPATANMAEFMVAYGIYDDLKSATTYFKGDGVQGPQYLTPQAYCANKLQEALGYQADTLIQPPFADPSWDAKASVEKLCKAAFDALKEIAVNAADQDSWDVFTAWVMGTGGLFGGHPAAPVTKSSGNNPGTGPSSVPAGTIFGGTGPQN